MSAGRLLLLLFRFWLRVFLRPAEHAAEDRAKASRAADFFILRLLAEAVVGSADDALAALAEQRAVFFEDGGLSVVEDERCASERALGAVEVRDSGQLAEVEGFDSFEELRVVFLELFVVLGELGELAVSGEERVQLVEEGALLSDAGLTRDDLVVDSGELFGEVFDVFGDLLHLVRELSLLALELEEALLQVGLFRAVLG